VQLILPGDEKKSVHGNQIGAKGSKLMQICWFLPICRSYFYLPLGLLPLAPEERCAVFPAAFSMMEKVALPPHCMYKYTIKGSEQ